jgi:hypothetical protein
MPDPCEIDTSNDDGLAPDCIRECLSNLQGFSLVVELRVGCGRHCDNFSNQVNQGYVSQKMILEGLGYYSLAVEGDWASDIAPP